MSDQPSMRPFLIVMLIALALAFFWDSIPFIKQGVNALLAPSAGRLLNWSATYGMVVITLIIALITLLAQKYATDQDAIRALKKEQKEVQKEMKAYREHPEKFAELSTKQMQTAFKLMSLTMRSSIYTIVPIILFFRWFQDYFTQTAVEPFGVHWLWSYIILTIIFSSMLRKPLNIA